jgi:hypothetical protein
MHTCTPNNPRCLVRQSPDYERVNYLGHDKRLVQRLNRDLRPTGGGKSALSIRKAFNIRGADQQLPYASIKARIKAHRQTMARKHSNSRVIGRINHIHAHPQHIVKKSNIATQIVRWQTNLCTYLCHGV